MATIFTHGYVGLVISSNSSDSESDSDRDKGIPHLHRPALLVPLLSIACSVFPDLDVVGLYLGIPYEALFGHRGFSHSLFFALLLSSLLMAIFFRRQRFFSPQWKRLFLIFFASTCSHGLLDALTNGGLGIAFFSPFSNHRYFFPFNPIEVSPIGAQAFLSVRGLKVILSELLYVVLPLFIFHKRALIRSLISRRIPTLIFLSVMGLFISSSLFINSIHPTNSYFYDSPHLTSGVIEPMGPPNASNNPNNIPMREEGPGKLITNFDKMISMGLINHSLTLPEGKRPWSSSFFPTWYGGISGRWQDPKIFLLMRTLLGMGFPTREESINLLHWAASGDEKSKELLFRYSPTEKYDLAIGDYAFSASKEESSINGHNHKGGLAPTWAGYCDGMSVASILFEEPFRKVLTLNPDGFRIVFHPNDIKALLGSMGQNFNNTYHMGARCNEDGNLQDERCRDINPASLVIAIANKLGMEKKSFIVEVEPGSKVRNFPLLDAFIKAASAPISINEGRMDLLMPGVPLEARFLVPVEIDIGLNSTNLSDYSSADVYEESAFEDGSYKKSQTFRIDHRYPALLALDQDKNIIGGKWTGEDMTGPDFIWFVDDSYFDFVEEDRPRTNRNFRWSVIKKLYEKSISRENMEQVLDLRDYKNLSSDFNAPGSEKRLAIMLDGCEKRSVPERCHQLGVREKLAGKIAQAKLHLSMACDLSYHFSCHMLASIFKDEKNIPAAKSKYQRGCYLDNSFSCNDLGFLEKVEGNLELAKKYLSLSCERDNKWGCYELGLVDESLKDMESGIDHFKKSCLLKYPESCHKMGNLMKLDHRMDQARNFYNKACDLGKDESCTQIKALKSLGQ